MHDFVARFYDHRPEHLVALSISRHNLMNSDPAEVSISTTDYDLLNARGLFDNPICIFCEHRTTNPEFGRLK